MKRPSAVKELVDELKRLPGVGQKTAERLAFFLMRSPKETTARLARAIENVQEKIRLCSVCHGITESDPCAICSDPSRDRSRILVVEEPHDVYIFESVGKYNGVYHVLMGVISPLDGVGPSDLTIDSLKKKVQTGAVSEVILAPNPDMEGESTSVFLAKMLKPFSIRVTRIARGLPVGSDIEYADSVTLLKSLEGRTEIL